MKKPSDASDEWLAQREKIIGLGERSLRKTYYPELQERLDELERFRALLDQSNDCIFLIQAQTLNFVDVNESACRQLGCSREELFSHPLGSFVPQEAVESMRELVKAGHAHGRYQDTITTDLRKCGGGEIPVEIIIRLVTFNKVLYGVAVARDITERKRAEKVMLENSRMLRDMELARQIQLSLLPTAPPEIPGVLLAGRCEPAALVGGDYYDFYRRKDGVLDMVIADVSGHSIGAALIMTEARSVLRAQIHSFTGTADLLASLNDILYEDLHQSGLLITLFYIKYDPGTRTVTYSNSGHAPPLVFRSSEGGCRKLDAEGLILGVRRGVIFEEKQFRMKEGDLLLLYTDGVTEARNASGELFGADRLCDILRAGQSGLPREVVDAVLREVATFTGTFAMEDDVTMIAMKAV